MLICLSSAFQKFISQVSQKALSALSEKLGIRVNVMPAVLLSNDGMNQEHRIAQFGCVLVNSLSTELFSPAWNCGADGITASFIPQQTKRKITNSECQGPSPHEVVGRSHVRFPGYSMIILWIHRGVQVLQARDTNVRATSIP